MRLLTVAEQGSQTSPAMLATVTCVDISYCVVGAHYLLMVGLSAAALRRARYDSVLSLGMLRQVRF